MQPTNHPPKKIIKVSWHSHSPIPVFFDRHNKRHIKRVDRYLRNMKKNGITVIAASYHNFINIRNKQYYSSGEINFFRHNVNPENQYEILCSRAEKMGMIILPALELETSRTLTTLPRQKIHLGIVHWDPRVIYYGQSDFLRFRPLYDLLNNLPPDAVVDLKHPWHHRYGVASFTNKEELKKIIEQYGLLIEKSGMGATTYTVFKKIYDYLPFLLWSKTLKKQFTDLHKLVTLEELSAYPATAGGDNHAIRPYPKGGGHIEIAFADNEAVTKQAIVEKVKSGQGRAVMPPMFFGEAFFSLVNSLPSLIKELTIETAINKTRARLIRKMKKETIKIQPDLDRLRSILYQLNDLKDIPIAKKDIMRIINDKY